MCESGNDLIDRECDRIRRVHIHRFRDDLQIAALCDGIAGFRYACAHYHLWKLRKFHRRHHAHAVGERNRRRQFVCRHALNRQRHRRTVRSFRVYEQHVAGREFFLQLRIDRYIDDEMRAGCVVCARRRRFVCCRISNVFLGRRRFGR